MRMMIKMKMRLTRVRRDYAAHTDLQTGRVYIYLMTSNIYHIKKKKNELSYLTCCANINTRFTRN
jgi:hypothetical protein